MVVSRSCCKVVHIGGLTIIWTTSPYICWKMWFVSERLVDVSTPFQFLHLNLHIPISQLETAKTIYSFASRNITWQDSKRYFWSANIGGYTEITFETKNSWFLLWWRIVAESSVLYNYLTHNILTVYLQWSQRLEATSNININIIPDWVDQVALASYVPPDMQKSSLAFVSKVMLNKHPISFNNQNRH